MSEEQLRILDLFKEGKINALETLELLDALNEIAAGPEQATMSGATAANSPQGDTDGSSKWSKDINNGYLQVSLIGGGDVAISGWEGDEVVINRPKPENGFHKSLYKQCGDGYKIYALNSDDYDIKVPYHYNLTIYTTGGDIRITNVSGQINGKTLGGDISLTDSKSRVNLTTAGGDIELSDCDAEGNVHSLGGDVVLRNVTGNVVGTTLGGDVIRS